MDRMRLSVTAIGTNAGTEYENHRFAMPVWYESLLWSTHEWSFISWSGHGMPDEWTFA